MLVFLLGSLFGIVVICLFLGFSFIIFFLKYRKKGHFFYSNGCKIHYTIEGQGPPIVLVHGFAVNADINWRWNGVIRNLRKYFTVIALDLRGHGLSDKPIQPNCYGIEMVNDILRLLDHLKIQKTYIMGYSMGGFITLKFVTLYPERVIKAIVGGAGFEKPTGENIQILMQLIDSVEKGEGYYPLIKFLEPGGKEPAGWKVKLINFFLNILSESKAMAKVMKQFLEFEVPEEVLQKNTVPILAIVGEKDAFKRSTEALEKVAHNVKVIYLENKDHTTALFPSDFIKHVLKFLTDES